MAIVLVVDDQEQNREILRRRLERKGHTIVEAEDGPEALDKIKKQPFDIVLLDIRMPGMDGNEVLEKIRANWNPMELPVIMVSAESDSKTMVKSLGLGADDYVTKPVDMPVLLARMENKLKLRANQQPKETAAQSLNPKEKIEALLTTGENNHVEFKSTLRWNIHAGKLGKEIEISWMKTVVAFLNTEGGTLLVGVDDTGKVLGTSLDKFKNDDKYLLHVNNSIKDFIGLEYISHIDFDLVQMEEEKVLCVECRPTKEAVFLKNNGEDEFYARFGPSSRKLSTKEVLGYMGGKKQN